MRKLKFLKALFSPFKPFRLKLYCGKTAVGVPYFLPRKWVKYTKEDAIKAAQEAIDNPKLVKKNFNDWVKTYEGYQKAVPRKVGFDFCGLGWKTKWEDTDYRFEWSPVLSFVFFGYQIALKVVVDNPDSYWTAWLYYERDTDKTKSKRERIEQCKKEFSVTYTVYETGKEKREVDYYQSILRKKYL